jgi:Rad3-related DNA helicase
VALSAKGDLPGARLIGAFVATLGLPQVNPVNEQIRQRMDSLLAPATTTPIPIPACRKWCRLRAASSAQTDRGTVYLIDDRFGRPELRALLPAWWHVE